MEILFFLSFLLFDDSGSEGAAAGCMGKRDDKESGERLWLSHRDFGAELVCFSNTCQPCFSWCPQSMELSSTHVAPGRSRILMNFK